ncbi:MAG: hypothetical protein LBQ71_11175 [Hungatella sp.]|jgi:3-oxoacyl-(acyl-carrier-protein) synthase|nr:hypothetical protein [Hungatella sp.]
METVVITGGSLIADKIPDNHENYLFPVLKLENVDYRQLIGGKGLRYLTDATKMALVTTNMLKEQTKVEEFCSERCGIVVATNFSSLAAIIDFDMAALTEGPRAVSAMQGPNLVLNATAAALGIHHNITGFNTTISSGRVASMDALEYAYEMIQKKEVDMVIVTGVEEIKKECKECFIDMNLMGITDFSQLKSFSGTVLLEAETHAMKRGAKIYGRVLKFSSGFNSNYLINGGNHTDGREEYTYMAEALSNDFHEIKNICISPYCMITEDQYELEFINDNFTNAKLISTYHVFGGELMGASGIAQMLHSLHTFEPGKGIIFCNDWTGNFRSLLLEKMAVV